MILGKNCGTNHSFHLNYTFIGLESYFKYLPMKVFIKLSNSTKHKSTRTVVSFLIYIVFNKNYTDGASATKANSFDEIISGFPGFQIQDGVVERGYLSYGGYMLGDTHKVIGKLDLKVSLSFLSTHTHTHTYIDFRVQNTENIFQMGKSDRGNSRWSIWRAACNL